MSDSALISTEAKAIHQEIKEALKTKEPFDKDVDLQRKNLRRRYLSLLFSYPYAQESKDVENHLWMQTSYTFIAVYKQHISALDRNQPRPNHLVERRKLLQRLRQFLTEEEKFWTQLIIRFRRSFGLDEAQSVLVKLEILSLNNDGKALEDSEVPPQRNNHYQFPDEDPSTDVTPTSVTSRESRLSILSKALICLGDLARYKEQYNETQGRSKVGSGKNKRDLPPRPRNYTRAKLCYEQARLLVPNEGNPSHQLAILAAYQKDNFSSLTYYYRALCVRQPYDTASENMETILGKALDQWRRTDHNIALDENVVAKLRLDAMTEKIVVLHALWLQGVEKTTGQALQLSGNIFQEFSVLISGHHLPPDIVNDIIVVSQSVLWKQRMIRNPHRNWKVKPDSRPPIVLPAYVIEARIISHVLSLQCALMEVAIDQLSEITSVDRSSEDLAVLAQQRISVVLRRILPSLRISSKWIRVNLPYLQKCAQSLAADRDTGSNDKKFPITDGSLGITDLWKTYAQFLRSLCHAFSVDKLPVMQGPLKEDVDMRGFLPLDGLMGDCSFTTVEDQEHPNVLNLMRIADLVHDAEVLVSMKNSPLMKYGNHFVTKGSDLTIPERYNGTGHLEETVTEIISQTDDDPVREAFGFLHGPNRAVIDDEDEDDVVLYLREPSSPANIPAVVSHHQSPVVSVKSLSSPVFTPLNTTPVTTKVPVSPPRVDVTSVAPTTAQDLLHDVMGPYKAGSKVLSPASTLLFGGDKPGQSIWAPAQDEQSLTMSNSSSLNNPMFPPAHHHHMQMQPTSPWSHMSASQTLPDGRHQRVLSTAIHLPIPPNGLGYHYPSTVPPQTLFNPGFDVYPSVHPESNIYYSAAPPDDRYHTGHISLHQTAGPPMFMSQTWGNGG